MGIYHRGYYFIRSYSKGGKDAVIDLSNGKLDIVQTRPGGGNSHRWFKFGDLVAMDIDNFQEATDSFPSQFGGSGAFVNLSNMTNRTAQLLPRMESSNWM